MVNSVMVCCHLVSGGRSGTRGDYVFHDTILVYNPETEGWIPAGKMRKGRGEHAVTVVEMEKVAPYCQERDVEQVEKSGCGAMKVSAAMVMVISLSIIWRH